VLTKLQNDHQPQHKLDPKQAAFLHEMKENFESLSKAFFSNERVSGSAYRETVLEHQAQLTSLLETLCNTQETAIDNESVAPGNFSKR
jgi:hypothetical protein